MGRFVNLAGVEGGVIEGDQGRFVGTVSQAMKALREVRLCSAAGDHGAVTVWRDDAGLFRCDFSRHRNTVATALWSKKVEVQAWLREWLPKCF